MKDDLPTGQSSSQKTNSYQHWFELQKIRCEIKNNSTNKMRLKAAIGF